MKGGSIIPRAFADLLRAGSRATRNTIPGLLHIIETAVITA